MSKKDGKKCAFNKPMVKRMGISLLFGLFFGLLCSYMSWSGDSSNPYSTDFWGSAMMWNIIFNRILIGVLIAFAGFVVIHPILGIRMFPALRGGLLGAIVSVDIVFGPFISGMVNSSFIAFTTILAGTVYGIIIDMVVTRFAGEGEDLIKDVMKI